MSTMPDDDIRALVGAAVPPAGPAPMDAIHERARRRARVRRAVVSSAAAAVLTVAVAGALLAWPRPELRFLGPLRVPETVLPLPAEGEVSPEFLRDGTPVFVAHAQDGQVFVVEARSPRYEDVDVLVGWCPAGETFEEPFGASRFDIAGHYRGGPSPTGLVARATRVRGDRVHVGEALPPPAREAVSPVRAPRMGAMCMDAQRSATPPAHGTVAHYLGAGTRAESPEDVADRGAARPVLVVGSIERVIGGPSRVCGAAPRAHQSPRVCSDDAPRLAPTDFEWFSDDPELAARLDPGQILGVHGAFLMTADAGTLTLRTVLPGLFEYGGWVPGAAPVEREGRLRLWEHAPSGVEGGRAEPPPLVLLLDDGSAVAVYPADDLAVFGGPVLLGIDGEGIPSTYERLREVLASGEHPDVRFRVTFSGAGGDATAIGERNP